MKQEVRETCGDNHRLLRRNAGLEALDTKDSHNSSRPPSANPPWAKRTKSLRRHWAGGRVVKLVTPAILSG